uniref:Uncharacterized protein n=1 Tax=Chromera velia CCMP2878 TaxID=1169474 RepID=A0A0G4HAW7_9ALVE|eukprot:Cvel_25677.t1-p1 / transcript=Cvel_25677.t1 / gene=Cvel_25677 / organism=Chromera_velia_CCMP2878 / gene_product=hypothetical protein / transcript_product=hypothetical protein / location=Cvel_scaffold2943:8779-9587(-) / protein_length=213 / sequence_SO=supercontig / SO=protein_coding / is_pseudo=false
MMGCSVLLAGMTRYLFRNKDEEPTETAFPESPLLVGLWLLICVLLIVHLTNAVKAREQFVSNIMYAKEKLRDLQDARFAFLRCKLCLLSTHAALAKATAYMMRVAIAGEQEARQRFLLDAPESDGGESDSTVDSENDGETEDGQPRPRTRAARHARILRTARENAARCLEEVRSAENRMEASRLFLDNTLHSARELEHWLPEDDRKLLTLNVS